MVHIDFSQFLSQKSLTVTWPRWIIQLSVYINIVASFNKSWLRLWRISVNFRLLCLPLSFPLSLLFPFPRSSYRFSLPCKQLQAKKHKIKGESLSHSNPSLNNPFFKALIHAVAIKREASCQKQTLTSVSATLWKLIMAAWMFIFNILFFYVCSSDEFSQWHLV